MSISKEVQYEVQIKKLKQELEIEKKKNGFLKAALSLFGQSTSGLNLPLSIKTISASSSVKIIRPKSLTSRGPNSKRSVPGPFGGVNTARHLTGNL